MFASLCFDLPGEKRVAERGAVLMNSRADTTHAVYVEAGRVVLGKNVQSTKWDFVGKITARRGRMVGTEFRRMRCCGGTLHIGLKAV